MLYEGMQFLLLFVSHREILQGGGEKFKLVVEKA